MCEAPKALLCILRGLDEDKVSYGDQVAQLWLEAVEELLEILRVILLLWYQLELLLFPGLDTQLQVFEAVLHTGQGLLDALSSRKVNDGVDALETHFHIYSCMRL